MAKGFLAALAALFAVGVALIATLPATAEERDLLPADPVVAEWPDWPYRAGCRDVTFDPNRVFGEAPAVGRGRGSLDRGLRRALRDLSVTWKHGPWRLARRAHGRAALLRGHPGAELESGDELEYIELARRHGRWRWTGSYSQLCYLRTVNRGRWADGWSLAPGQPLPGPGTRAVRVTAGVHCSRKEKPPVIAGEPQFDEINGKLVMTLWLHYRGFGANEICDWGLPDWPPIEIELPEALGDRELFDGGEYPPRPAKVYEKPSVIGL